jgi:hypothetical protein
MSTSRRIRGRRLPVDDPEWEPLLNLAPDHVSEFIWVGAVQLTDGTRLQVYEHAWTRGCLHLGEDGRAFVLIPKTRYEEVNPPWLLLRVLGVELEERYSVRRNVWPEEVRITFARSATKHRITRERSLGVVERCGFQLVDRLRNPAGSGIDKRVYFLGRDLEGVPLEVVAVELDEEDFLVIHALELRSRFRALYEEARLWEK